MDVICKLAQNIEFKKTKKLERLSSINITTVRLAQSNLSTGKEFNCFKPEIVELIGQKK
jgi:hypothetical protein